MEQRSIQIDLFGSTVLIQNKHGQQVLYSISLEEDLYKCFVQRRSSEGARWKPKKLIESSNKFIKFVFADNESGFKLERE